MVAMVHSIQTVWLLIFILFCSFIVYSSRSPLILSVPFFYCRTSHWDRLYMKRTTATTPSCCISVSLIICEHVCMFVLIISMESIEATNWFNLIIKSGVVEFVIQSPHTEIFPIFIVLFRWHFFLLFAILLSQVAMFLVFFFSRRRRFFCLRRSTVSIVSFSFHIFIPHSFRCSFLILVLPPHGVRRMPGCVCSWWQRWRPTVILMFIVLHTLS